MMRKYRKFSCSGSRDKLHCKAGCSDNPSIIACPCLVMDKDLSKGTRFEYDAEKGEFGKIDK